MLFPSWESWGLGPLLRRESDLRLYLDLFKKPASQIGGVRKFWIQRSFLKITEPVSISQPYTDKQSADGLITFEKLLDYYAQLNGWNAFLLEEIRGMTREKWLKKAAAVPVAPVGIHVRRGDFVLSGSGIPISWFVKSLLLVRKIAGYPAKALIFSDGSARELRDILNLPHTSYIATGSAIGDLLSLAKQRFLIAPGGSTFSAWASFLGQMPTVTYPGQPLSWYQMINQDGLHKSELDPDHSVSKTLENQILSATKPAS